MKKINAVNDKAQIGNIVGQCMFVFTRTKLVLKAP